MRTVLRRFLPLIIATGILPSTLVAQATGRISGRIVTADGGIPLGGAVVSLVGTPVTIRSAVDGRYTFLNVPAGTADVRVVMIGYSPKVVTGVPVVADSTTRQDISMTSALITLAEISVTAEVERGTVNAAIDLQRNAVGIVSATSAEQIARSPDGDAAAALQRVSGASVRDGKPSVRGLDGKSTTGVLNGARMISSEPEKKTIDLGLIPSSLLETIEVSKTATADQEGDFAGAIIRIRTKEAIDRPFTTLSLSSGFNSAITGRTVLGSPLMRGDLLAAGAGQRALPGALSAADLGAPLPQQEMNRLVNSVRNVWSARSRQGVPNAGLGFSTGGTVPPSAGGVSYLLSGSWSLSEEARVNERRAVAAPTATGIEEQDRFEGSTGRQSVLWGGIANFGVNVGSATRFTFNNTYTRSMDNEARREHGSSENLGGQRLDVTRLRYVERSVRSDRLAMQRSFGPRHQLDLAVSYGSVRRQEPDRSEMVYVRPADGAPAQWLGFSNEAAVRTFGDLRERAIEGSADWQVRLGDATTSARSLKAGLLLRDTRRDADNRSYSIALLRSLPEGSLAQAPESIFNGGYTGTDDAYFRIVPLFAGGSYGAKDRLLAGYAQVTLPLAGALEMTGGARLERSSVEVSSLSTAQEASRADLALTDLLPSLALTWRERPTTNVRFSVARTLARPEYRELSPILAREVIGGDNIKGDPGLKRSLIENYDLRWEHYPAAGELLSVALFAKKFHDPMERVYLATSGTHIITTVNALGATDYGIELEARRPLARDEGFFSRLTVATNVTLMKSRITLDPGTSSLTNPDRRMVGQAPYLVNASLTWTSHGGRASATVLFNRIGDRITEAGEAPLPDVVEKPRSLLDLSLRFPLLQDLGVKMTAQNLLDAPVRVMQGEVTRSFARTGRVLAVGFSWNR